MRLRPKPAENFVKTGNKHDFTKYFEIVENEQKTGYALKLKDQVKITVKLK